MRLFVGLQIPPDIRERFAVLIDELRSVDAKLTGKKPRWVRPENLHVTLKFIGETVPEKLDAFREALNKVRSTAPVDLRFRGLGFFPNSRRPKVIWGGMDASPNLATLAGDVDRQIATLGVPAERREYAPHLTLARCEPPVLSSAVLTAIEKRAMREFGELQTSAFHLIESKLKRTGAEYTTLQSYFFAAKD